MSQPLEEISNLLDYLKLEPDFAISLIPDICTNILMLSEHDINNFPLKRLYDGLSRFFDPRTAADAEVAAHAIRAFNCLVALAPNASYSFTHYPEILTSIADHVVNSLSRGSRIHELTQCIATRDSVEEAVLCLSRVAAVQPKHALSVGAMHAFALVLLATQPCRLLPAPLYRYIESVSVSKSSPSPSDLVVAPGAQITWKDFLTKYADRVVSVASDAFKSALNLDRHQYDTYLSKYPEDSHVRIPAEARLSAPPALVPAEPTSCLIQLSNVSIRAAARGVVLLFEAFPFDFNLATAMEERWRSSVLKWARDVVDQERCELCSALNEQLEASQSKVEYQPLQIGELQDESKCRSASSSDDNCATATAYDKATNEAPAAIDAPSASTDASCAVNLNEISLADKVSRQVRESLPTPLFPWNGSGLWPIEASFTALRALAGHATGFLWIEELSRTRTFPPTTDLDHLPLYAKFVPGLIRPSRFPTQVSVDVYIRYGPLPCTSPGRLQKDCIITTQPPAISIDDQLNREFLDLVDKLVLELLPSCTYPMEFCRRLVRCSSSMFSLQRTPFATEVSRRHDLADLTTNDIVKLQYCPDEVSLDTNESIGESVVLHALALLLESSCSDSGKGSVATVCRLLAIYAALFKYGPPSVHRYILLNTRATLCFRAMMTILHPKNSQALVTEQENPAFPTGMEFANDPSHELHGQESDVIPGTADEYGTPGLMLGEDDYDWSLEDAEQVPEVYLKNISTEVKVDSPAGILKRASKNELDQVRSLLLTLMMAIVPNELDIQAPADEMRLPDADLNGFCTSDEPLVLQLRPRHTPASTRRDTPIPMRESFPRARMNLVIDNQAGFAPIREEDGDPSSTSEDLSSSDGAHEFVESFSSSDSDSGSDSDRDIYEAEEANGDREALEQSIPSPTDQSLEDRLFSRVGEDTLMEAHGLVGAVGTSTASERDGESDRDEVADGTHLSYSAHAAAEADHHNLLGKRRRSESSETQVDELQEASNDSISDMSTNPGSSETNSSHTEDSNQAVYPASVSVDLPRAVIPLNRSEEAVDSDYPPSPVLAQRKRVKVEMVSTISDLLGIESIRDSIQLTPPQGEGSEQQDQQSDSRLPSTHFTPTLQRFGPMYTPAQLHFFDIPSISLKVPRPLHFVFEALCEGIVPLVLGTLIELDTADLRLTPWLLEHIHKPRSTKEGSDNGGSSSTETPSSDAILLSPPLSAEGSHSLSSTTSSTHSSTTNIPAPAHSPHGAPAIQPSLQEVLELYCRSILPLASNDASRDKSLASSTVPKLIPWWLLDAEYEVGMGRFAFVSGLRKRTPDRPGRFPLFSGLDRASYPRYNFFVPLSHPQRSSFIRNLERRPQQVTAKNDDPSSHLISELYIEAECMSAVDAYAPDLTNSVLKRDLLSRFLVRLLFMHESISNFEPKPRSSFSLSALELNPSSALVNLLPSGPLCFMRTIQPSLVASMLATTLPPLVGPLEMISDLVYQTMLATQGASSPLPFDRLNLNPHEVAPTIVLATTILRSVACQCIFADAYSSWADLGTRFSARWPTGVVNPELLTVAPSFSSLSHDVAVGSARRSPLGIAQRVDRFFRLACLPWCALPKVSREEFDIEVSEAANEISSLVPTPLLCIPLPAEQSTMNTSDPVTNPDEIVLAMPILSETFKDELVQLDLFPVMHRISSSLARENRYRQYASIYLRLFPRNITLRPCAFSQYAINEMLNTLDEFGAFKAAKADELLRLMGQGDTNPQASIESIPSGRPRDDETKASFVSSKLNEFSSVIKLDPKWTKLVDEYIDRYLFFTHRFNLPETEAPCLPPDDMNRLTLVHPDRLLADLNDYLSINDIAKRIGIAPPSMRLSLLESPVTSARSSTTSKDGPGMSEGVIPTCVRLRAVTGLLLRIRHRFETISSESYSSMPSSSEPERSLLFFDLVPKLLLYAHVFSILRHILDAKWGAAVRGIMGSWLGGGLIPRSTRPKSDHVVSLNSPASARRLVPATDGEKIPLAHTMNTVRSPTIVSAIHHCMSPDSKSSRPTSTGRSGPIIPPPTPSDFETSQIWLVLADFLALSEGSLYEGPQSFTGFGDVHLRQRAFFHIFYGLPLFPFPFHMTVSDTHDCQGCVSPSHLSSMNVPDYHAKWFRLLRSIPGFSPQSYAEAFEAFVRARKLGTFASSGGSGDATHQRPLLSTVRRSSNHHAHALLLPQLPTQVFTHLSDTIHWSLSQIPTHSLATTSRVPETLFDFHALALPSAYTSTGCLHPLLHPVFALQGKISSDNARDKFDLIAPVLQLYFQSRPLPIFDMDMLNPASLRGIPFATTPSLAPEFTPFRLLQAMFHTNRSVPVWPEDEDRDLREAAFDRFTGLFGHPKCSSAEASLRWTTFFESEAVVTLHLPSKASSELLQLGIAPYVSQRGTVRVTGMEELLDPRWLCVPRDLPHRYIAHKLMVDGDASMAQLSLNDAAVARDRIVLSAPRSTSVYALLQQIKARFAFTRQVEARMVALAHNLAECVRELAAFCANSRSGVSTAQVQVQMQAVCNQLANSFKDLEAATLDALKHLLRSFWPGIPVSHVLQDVSIVEDPHAPQPDYDIFIDVYDLRGRHLASCSLFDNRDVQDMHFKWPSVATNLPMTRKQWLQRICAWIDGITSIGSFEDYQTLHSNLHRTELSGFYPGPCLLDMTILDLTFLDLKTLHGVSSSASKFDLGTTHEGPWCASYQWLAVPPTSDDVCELLSSPLELVVRPRLSPALTQLCRRRLLHSSGDACAGVSKPSGMSPSAPMLFSRSLPKLSTMQHSALRGWILDMGIKLTHNSNQALSRAASLSCLEGLKCLTERWTSYYNFGVLGSVTPTNQEEKPTTGTSQHTIALSVHTTLPPSLFPLATVGSFAEAQPATCAAFVLELASQRYLPASLSDTAYLHAPQALERCALRVLDDPAVLFIGTIPTWARKVLIDQSFGYISPSARDKVVLLSILQGTQATSRLVAARYAGAQSAGTFRSSGVLAPRTQQSVETEMNHGLSFAIMRGNTQTPLAPGSLFAASGAPHPGSWDPRVDHITVSRGTVLFEAVKSLLKLPWFTQSRHEQSLRNKATFAHHEAIWRLITSVTGLLPRRDRCSLLARETCEWIIEPSIMQAQFLITHPPLYRALQPSSISMTHAVLLISRLLNAQLDWRQIYPQLPLLTASAFAGIVFTSRCFDKSPATQQPHFCIDKSDLADLLSNEYTEEQEEQSIRDIIAELDTALLRSVEPSNRTFHPVQLMYITRTPRSLRVRFDQEAGIGTGPTIEFFAEFGRELQRQGLGLWIESHSTSSSKGRIRSDFMSPVSSVCPTLTFQTSDNSLVTTPGSAVHTPADMHSSPRSPDLNPISVGQILEVAARDRRVLQLALASAITLPDEGILFPTKPLQLDLLKSITSPPQLPSLQDTHNAAIADLGVTPSWTPAEIAALTAALKASMEEQTLTERSTTDATVATENRKRTKDDEMFSVMDFETCVQAIEARIGEGLVVNEGSPAVGLAPYTPMTILRCKRCLRIRPLHCPHHGASLTVLEVVSFDFPSDAVGSHHATKLRCPHPLCNQAVTVPKPLDKDITTWEPLMTVTTEAERESPQDIDLECSYCGHDAEPHATEVLFTVFFTQSLLNLPSVHPFVCSASQDSMCTRARLGSEEEPTQKAWNTFLIMCGGERSCLSANFCVLPPAEPKFLPSQLDTTNFATSVLSPVSSDVGDASAGEQKIYIYRSDSFFRLPPGLRTFICFRGADGFVANSSLSDPTEAILLPRDDLNAIVLTDQTLEPTVLHNQITPQRFIERASMGRYVTPNTFAAAPLPSQTIVDALQGETAFDQLKAQLRHVRAPHPLLPSRRDPMSAVASLHSHQIALLGYISLALGKLPDSPVLDQSILHAVRRLEPDGTRQDLIELVDALAPADSCAPLLTPIPFFESATNRLDVVDSRTREVVNQLGLPTHSPHLVGVRLLSSLTSGMFEQLHKALAHEFRRNTVEEKSASVRSPPAAINSPGVAESARASTDHDSVHYSRDASVSNGFSESAGQVPSASLLSSPSVETNETDKRTDTSPTVTSTESSDSGYPPSANESPSTIEEKVLSPSKCSRYADVAPSLTHYLTKQTQLLPKVSSTSVLNSQSVSFLLLTRHHDGICDTPSITITPINPNLVPSNMSTMQDHNFMGSRQCQRKSVIPVALSAQDVFAFRKCAIRSSVARSELSRAMSFCVDKCRKEASQQVLQAALDAAARESEAIGKISAMLAEEIQEDVVPAVGGIDMHETTIAVSRADTVLLNDYDATAAPPSVSTASPSVEVPLPIRVEATSEVSSNQRKDSKQDALAEASSPVVYALVNEVPSIQLGGNQRNLFTEELRREVNIGLYPRPQRDDPLKISLYYMLGVIFAYALSDHRAIEATFALEFFEALRSTIRQLYSLNGSSGSSVSSQAPITVYNLPSMLPGAGKAAYCFAAAHAACESLRATRLAVPDEFLYDGASISDLGLDLELPSLGSDDETQSTVTSAPLTYSNCHEYADMLLHALNPYVHHQSLSREPSVTSAFVAVVAGLATQLQPTRLLMMSPEALRRELCVAIPPGGYDFTVETLEKHIRLTGYTPDSAPIKYLFKALSELTPSEQVLFLKFVTATGHLPPRGLIDLNPPITIVRVPLPTTTSTTNTSASTNTPREHQEPTKVYPMPSVMTCGRTLKLPDYPSYEILRERLLQAIRECSGFQMS